MTHRATCSNCSVAFQAHRWDKHFCSRTCKDTSGNLEKRRGQQIYALAYRWRFDRGNSQAYLKALCRLLARFHDEDLKAGRPLPHLYPEQVSQMDGVRPDSKPVGRARALYSPRVLAATSTIAGQFIK